MNTRCYIVDDEPHAVKILKRYIDKTPELKLDGFETNSMEAWNKLVNKKITPDVMFLDIAMPQISGIELAGLAKGMTTIIFTTAHPEYGSDACQDDAIDYLLKPISYQRFLRSIAKVKRLIGSHSSEAKLHYDSFCVKSEIKGRVAVLKYDDVIYIEGKSNSTIIHHSDDKNLINYSLKDFEEELPNDRFLRIHKSYIVNLNKITAVESGKVVLHDGKRLEIGPSYKSSLYDYINKILINKTNTGNKKHR